MLELKNGSLVLFVHKTGEKQVLVLYNGQVPGGYLVYDQTMTRKLLPKEIWTPTQVVKSIKKGG